LPGLGIARGIDDFITSVSETPTTFKSPMAANATRRDEAYVQCAAAQAEAILDHGASGIQPSII
jgi:hypothetical protein